MKKLAKVLLVCGFAAATMASVVVAQVPSTIVVDEFGLGTYNGAPLPSGVFPDPFSGGLQLAYTLPFVAAPGGPFDIVMAEPGGQFSDILRFVPGVAGPGTTALFFYSDGSDGFDAPADVPFLPAPIGGPPVLLETGLIGPGLPGPYSEAGPNGLVYFVGPGGFGSDGNPLGTQYTFVSDGVIPEPATVTLLGLGALGLLAIIRRRQ